MIVQFLTARLWMLTVYRFGLRRASKIAGKPGGGHVVPGRRGAYWPDGEISKQCGPKGKVLSKHPRFSMEISVSPIVIMRDCTCTP